MLTIRQDQVESFRQYHLQKFEDEMVEHSKKFTPRLCEVLGDSQLRVAIRSAMKRADGYGFTNRGPIRLFIEMMFLCGSAFDTDPQYSAVGDVLRSPGDQMIRAEKIYEGSLDYLEKVSGPGAVNVHKALADLLLLARGPLTFPNGFVAEMLSHMGRVFPQKADWVGEAGLKAVIEEGVNEARHHQFKTLREGALLVVLKFAFGHGCTNDPLYPWIGATLTDPKIKDPNARATRLEKKAITWLEHVVAGNEQQVHA
jgi:hypothetical protein